MGITEANPNECHAGSASQGMLQMTRITSRMLLAIICPRVAVPRSKDNACQLSC